MRVSMTEFRTDSAQCQPSYAGECLQFPRKRAYSRGERTNTPHVATSVLTPPIQIESSSPLGLEVPISRIDHELRRLWEQDEARSNASLINLVVYSEKTGALSQNSGIIRDLTRDHACRAILVEIDRTTEDSSQRAWITAHCHLSHGMKSVCCEQIAIHLTGRVRGRIRSTVFSHLNADLPVVLWWQSELTEVFDERLASVIDRFIFDSSEWADARSGFAILEETHKTSDRRMILQDLAWTRVWPFRQCVARLYDDATALAALPDVRHVEIRHHPAHLNSALLVLAWLASRADWRDTDDGSLDQTSPTGQRISVALQPDDAAPVLGGIRIEARTTVVSVGCRSGCSHYHGRVEAPEHTVTSVSPAAPTACEALVREQLSRGGRNALYQQILPRFRQMLETATPPTHPS